MERYNVGLTIEGYLKAENQQDAEEKVENFITEIVEYTQRPGDIYYSIITDFVAKQENKKN